MSLRTNFPACNCLQWPCCGSKALVMGTLASVAVLTFGGFCLLSKTQMLPSPGNWIATGTGGLFFLGFSTALIRNQMKRKQELSGQAETRPKLDSSTPSTTSRTSANSSWHEESPPPLVPSRRGTLQPLVPSNENGPSTVLKRNDRLKFLEEWRDEESLEDEGPEDSSNNSQPILATASPFQNLTRTEYYVNATRNMPPPPPLSIPGTVGMPAITLSPDGPLPSGFAQSPQMQLPPDASLGPKLLAITPQKIDGLLLQSQIEPYNKKRSPVTDQEVIKFFIDTGVLKVVQNSRLVGLCWERGYTVEDEDSEALYQGAENQLEAIDGWQESVTRFTFSREQIAEYSRYADTAVTPQGSYPINEEYRRKRKKDTGQEFFMNAVGLLFGTQSPIIVTQGPTIKTLEDFWELVWESNARYVINLTDFKEGEKEKCAQYFPTEKPFCAFHGGFKIENLGHATHFGPEAPLYDITVNLGSEQKIVSLLHVKYWKDQRAIDPAQLYEIVKHMDEQNLKGPFIVHCSAGVGRTGVFCGAYWLYKIAKYAHANNQHYKISLTDLVCLMRLPPFGRIGMVQSPEQLILIENFVKLLPNVYQNT